MPSPPLLPGVLQLALPGEPGRRIGAPLEDLLVLARGAWGSLAAALEVARGAGPVVPLPAGGRTGVRWEFLAQLAAVDLTVARVVEAHLDALAILAECPQATSDSPAEALWGVFAAQGQGGAAHAAQGSGGWRLNGTKPWCSAAASLDRALVTARTPAGSRLFAVDLHHDGVVPQRGRWVARGLVEVPSGPVELHDVPGVPVGEPGWYVDRDGLGWGGMGVAACWYGGAVGVARRLWHAAQERTPDDVALVHLGAVDTVLELTRGRLALAAAELDRGQLTGLAGRLVAQRVRSAAARCVDEVLTRAGHGLGPAPLALDDEHARRVADLQLYVRQHHAERDERTAGRLLVELGGW